MREVIIMHETKLNDDWGKTSFVMAMILNVNKDTEKYGVTPFDEFNPYRFLGATPVDTKKSEEKKSKYAFSMMKKLWVDNAPERKFAKENINKTKKV